MHHNLLFSINDNFSTQLVTTLYSIRENSSFSELSVYVMQQQPLKQNDKIAEACHQLGINYHPVVVGPQLFKDSPTTDRYPETIYYRLLAQEFLPAELERILYLDADILCINDLRPLLELKMGEAPYAAASHSQLTEMANVINKVRLQNYEAESYFNSGVLLMNLPQIRPLVSRQAIFEFIEKNRFQLFLPDQDVLNGLYGERILPLPDQLYNFDVRKKMVYETISRGQWDLDWVVAHTVLLHFCGRDKPWQSDYSGRFGALYKHYQHRSPK
ncbi:glycosyltransferase family 8 protein [Enterococcus sp. AD013-P3]|uniref:glycosyltransferase family 8 protein n=1 Tax=Enterococcus sp. AD013-P3 TaxID=3411036 RepID=UPI003B94E489